MGLTELDIQILRQADALTFRDDASTHEIRATLRDRSQGDQSGQEFEHHIAVSGYVAVFRHPDNTGVARSRTMTSARAFATSNARGVAMVPASMATYTWVNLLQAGDGLVLLWSANNTPSELREMGLAHDELHLSVFREQREWYRFLVAARVCRTDAADRMIRLALDW